MSWLKKLKNWDGPVRSPPDTIDNSALTNVDNSVTICFDAFKSHWLQICEVISATSPRHAFIQTLETIVPRIDNITADDVDTVRNLLEQMIFLLVEEQSSGELLGPILEFTITQDIFEKMHDWWDKSSVFKEQMMLNLLKVYEVLISQAQHSLLHHKQLVTPMLKLLSSTYEPKSDELDGHIVLLLNLLCVWMNRDPTLLEVFFNASANHGPAKFLIFSLLIEYIHREGTVGQQARDALLLCMSLSAENSMVASYIVDNSNFCPVLATGLSALYSMLPRHMEVRADDWHCLQRNDWSHVPELINFMNSFEFCNSVIEVSHESVSEQLLDFFYNGFLVSVFGPSLHKTSADEVVVTTAYLNLFLRSVTAPALMRCFLRFLLTHRHESGLIINTLIQRIASSNRLALVSLSLIRTLVDLNCEDLMLQLVLRYLLPCQHILASQRRAIRDVDIHNASASRFLALTPAVCVVESSNDKDEEIFLPVTQQSADDTSETSSVARRQLPGVSEVVSPERNHGNGAFHTLSPPPPMHDPPPHRTPIYRKSQSNYKTPPAIGANHAVSDYTVNEDLSVTINMHSADSDSMEMTPEHHSRTITSPSTMAEFGPDLKSQLELNTSYMDYLEDAKVTIDQCTEACSGWSAAYDGVDPVGPDPVQTSAITIPQNVTIDTLPSHSHDTALKALTATYKAINLTAKALDTSNTFPDAQAKTSSFVTLHNITQPPEVNTTPQQSEVESDKIADAGVSDTATINHTSDNTVVNGVISESTEETTNTETEKSTEQMVTESSIENNLDENSNEPAKLLGDRLTQEEDSYKIQRANSNTVSSSVDEFFRSLMEIVPKTTREKVENGKAQKVAGITNADDDIESGIEVSSEGDAQTTSPERVGNDTEQDGDAVSQQDEDSMSQLSLNTDEMDDAAEKTPRDNAKSTHHSNTTYVDGDATTPHNYSYTDETDDEFDDTASIASTSFYEPCDEYSPTDISVSPSAPLKLQGIPYTGPLIGNLFAKLDQMITNSLYENLLLTGIVTRLAAYPQPLLRSFLLNTHMVFHPSVRSLYQVLNSARNKIDSYAAQVSDFKVLVRRAQKYLLARGTFPFSGDARTRNTVQDKPMPVPRVKTRTFGDMFVRRKPKEKSKKKSLFSLGPLLERRGRTESKEGDDSDLQPQESANDSSSLFYIRQRLQQREKEERKLKELRTKNAVYASIVLAEFLKELAAVAQEHAVASVQY